jgi:hypothetical protein
MGGHDLDLVTPVRSARAHTVLTIPIPVSSGSKL